MNRHRGSPGPQGPRAGTLCTLQVEDSNPVWDRNSAGVERLALPRSLLLAPCRSACARHVRVCRWTQTTAQGGQGSRNRARVRAAPQRAGASLARRRPQDGKQSPGVRPSPVSLPLGGRCARATVVLLQPSSEARSLRVGSDHPSAQRLHAYALNHNGEGQFQAAGTWHTPTRAPPAILWTRHPSSHASPSPCV